jgi:hypothetical protein
MILIEFLAIAYLGHRLPEMPISVTMMFVPIALVTMVAEGLQ